MKSIEVTVVGLKHRATPSTLRAIARAIDEGPVMCSIEREPENVHDENAVKVVIQDVPWKGLHVGYITRKTASILAPAMDDDKVRKPKLYLLSLVAEHGVAGGTLEWKSPGRAKKSKK